MGEALPTFSLSKMKIAQRIVGYLKSIRTRMIQRSTQTLLHRSTAKARQFLEANGPLRILIDSSVLGHGITHETEWISTGPKKWGNVEINSGYLARIPVHSPVNDGRTYNEVRYLPGIAQLAKAGLLQLWSSGELEAERFRQPAGRFGGYGWYDKNVFADVNIDRIDGLTYLDIHDPGKAQQARLSLCKDQLYLSLVKILGPQNNLDAFHIFTAEKFGLDAFLCIDFKLIRLVRDNAANAVFANLKTKILLPSEISETMGLEPIDTNLLTSEGSSFPVHPEKHMESEQRRPKNKYGR